MSFVFDFINNQMARLRYYNKKLYMIYFNLKTLRDITVTCVVYM